MVLTHVLHLRRGAEAGFWSGQGFSSNILLQKCRMCQTPCRASLSPTGLSLLVARSPIRIIFSQMAQLCSSSLHLPVGSAGPARVSALLLGIWISSPIQFHLQISGRCC